MDLNNLFFRHQISLMRASAAGSGETQARHRADAEGIASQIGQFQRLAGAGAALAWDALRLADHSPSDQGKSPAGARQ